jgi:hypothetical protein
LLNEDFPILNASMNLVWYLTNISTDRNSVIKYFVNNEDSIPFEIALHLGNAAIGIADHSLIPSESGILTAASTGCKIEGVKYIDRAMAERDDLDPLKISAAKISYFPSCPDCHIDKCASRVLIEGNVI